MFGDLAHDVATVLQPNQLGAGRRRKDGNLAILAAIPELRYCDATESETSFSVV